MTYKHKTHAVDSDGKIISNAEILGMNSNIHTSRFEITHYGDINAVDARSYWQWRIESIPRKSANRKG